MTSKFAFFHHVPLVATTLFRKSGGSVPVRIIPISLPDGRIIERKVGDINRFWAFFLHIFLIQSTEQSSIDIEFTECLNTSFATKSHSGEKMKGGGGNTQQTTESENLGSCNQPKREGDANNNNNEENLRKWKTNLEAACQGEKLSVGSAGGHLDGWRRLSGGHCQLN